MRRPRRLDAWCCRPRRVSAPCGRRKRGMHDMSEILDRKLHAAASIVTAIAGLVLTLGVAQAQLTDAQKSAMRANCRSDFMANCMSTSPGSKEALECLQNNLAKLSPGCQAAVKATMPPPPAAAAPPPPPRRRPRPPRRLPYRPHRRPQLLRRLPRRLRPAPRRHRPKPRRRNGPRPPRQSRPMLRSLQPYRRPRRRRRRRLNRNSRWTRWKSCRW